MIAALVGVGGMLFGHIIQRLLSEDPPGAGALAPSFALAPLGDGPAVRLDELRGQVVLLEFWTSTCVGCIGATPKLNRLHRRYADRDLTILGINMDADGGVQAREVVQRRAIEYPVLLDPGPVALAYGIYATPTAVLVGPDGRISAVHRGNVTETRLEAEIRALLPGEPETPESGSRGISFEGQTAGLTPLSTR